MPAEKNLSMFRILTIPFDPAIKGFNDDLLNQFVLNKSVTHYQTVFFQASTPFSLNPV
jgi:hypothetical protein